VDSALLSVVGTHMQEIMYLHGLEYLLLDATVMRSQHHPMEILELMLQLAPLLMSWLNQSLIHTSMAGTTRPQALAR
jgi:hypothetical protein